VLTNQRLLGFSARERWLSPPGDGAREGGWTEENKRAWLLHSDVERPLSVDHLVWPTVFDVDQTLLEPDYHGPLQDLWSDLGAMISCIDKQWKGSWKSSAIIAITLCLPEAGELAAEISELGMDTTIPATIDSEWHVLGFDVADRWLLSGLSNCTHTTEADFQALRQRFAFSINRYHLFDLEQHARDFRCVSDLRVKDHAPFFVFCIWLIGERPQKGRPQEGC
jgi:hypothetical protein